MDLPGAWADQEVSSHDTEIHGTHMCWGSWLLQADEMSPTRAIAQPSWEGNTLTLLATIKNSYGKDVKRDQQKH